MTDSGFVLVGEEQVRMAQFFTLRQALRMELAGMKRRGRSAYSIVKEIYGYKGSKQSVMDQMNADYDKFWEERHAESN
jgi:uncharacterized protein VirK/YbjX